LEPKAVLPYQHRGEVYRQQGDLKKSAEQLTKALEIVPGDATTLLLRANVQYQLKDYDGALKDVETVIKAQPQLLVAYLLQAEIYATTDRVGQAIQVLEKLVPLAPNQPQLLEPLATYYLISGQPRKSIETFSRVLELKPDDYRALRFRGDAQLNIGDHAAAIADFDAALKLNDEDEGLLNNFAWVLATSPDDKVRDGQKSLEMATKAAEMTTYTVPHIVSTLAAAYAEIGDFEAAKEWSKKAVELAENDADREQLGKELASYEAGKPWRETQQQEDKSASPSTSDHTFAPPSVKPAPARTLDF
jgi:tetratricopeptide (TPR) repeat protein